MPDPVRGKFAHIKNEAKQCDAYLTDLAAVIESERDEITVCSVAAFIAESFPSCAGHIVFPKNYLKKF